MGINEVSSTVTQAAGLSMHGMGMLIFTLIIFAIFIWDRLPISTVCLAILAILPLAFVLFPLQIAQGEVDPLRFFAGFGHPALVAICALMIVGHALEITGALSPAARYLSAWVAASPRMALLGLLVGAASVSGIINDTPVVVLLIPLIIAAAKRASVPAGTMLLPMNYAVLIGGMATTIGTSTNLIVVAIAASLGVSAIGMFSFFPLVAMAAVPGLLYLWLVAPRMLKHVKPQQEQLSEDVFDAELHVEKDAWLDGKEVREVLKATGRKLRIKELRRGSYALTRLPSLIIRAGDRLLVQDTAANLKDYESSLKAKLHSVNAESGNANNEEAVKTAEALVTAIVAQLIITPRSSLVGRSVKQERFAERYNVVLVGLRPRQTASDWQRDDNLADRSIGTGDILLLQGTIESIQQAQRDGIGLLLDERLALPRQDKAIIALLTMALVVLLAATKTLPIAIAALGGALALLATRCMSWQEVTQSLSAKVILLVAASLALGDALSLTGATAWLAGVLANIASNMSPAWVLALLMGLMGLLTNFVSNNAAAAIGTPLGIELARALGVAPEPFVLAVLFGCNLCYLTPMGYQTNLLVMNAGGYRFSDFMKVGTPLFLIMWAGLTYSLIWRYQL